MIATDAYVNKGDVFKFTCKVNTSVDMVGITLKFDSDKEIYFENATLSTQANTDKTFTAIGKSDKDVKDILFVLDFGNNPAATVKVSDLNFQIVDVDTITVDTIEINSDSDTISSGDTVNLTFTMNGQYPIDPEYSFTEEGVSGSTKAGNAITAGTVEDSTGKITVTATYKEKSATKVITVTKEKDYGKYFKEGTWVSEAELTAYGYMALWYVADTSWNSGSVVTVSDVSASETEYKLTRNDIGDNSWSTQIFYKEEAGTYEVSFDMESSVSGDITFNGEPYSLTENKKESISGKKFTLPLDKVDDDAKKNTLISIQLGVVEGESEEDKVEKVLPAGTFTISNFSVTKVN